MSPKHSTFESIYFQLYSVILSCFPIVLLFNILYKYVICYRISTNIFSKYHCWSFYELDIEYILCPIDENFCLIDENSCPIDKNLGPIDENFCPIDENFCLIDEKSCPIDKNFCPIDKNSCPIDENFCSIDKNYKYIIND